MIVLGLDNGGTELHGERAPFPVAATRSAGKREGFAELTRLFGPGDFKILCIGSSVIADLLVHDDGHVERELRGGVAATAVDFHKFIKTDARGVAACDIEQHRCVSRVQPGELEQRGSLEFPTPRILVGERLDVLGDESVAATELERLELFVADGGAGDSFFIGQEGHDCF